MGSSIEDRLEFVREHIVIIIESSDNKYMDKCLDGDPVTGYP